MGLEADKHELGSFNVTEQPAGSPSSDNGAQALGTQTRTRRLFSSSQLFAFSLMYLVSWGYVGSNMYYSIQNGGPAAWLFSYIIVFVGVLAQAASLAELASIQPIAGAQYYWTFDFAPPSTRRFLTWIQGWSTWFAYVAAFASALDGNAVILEGVISLNHPDYVVKGWHTALIMIGTLALCALVNMYAFAAVPWFELLSGVLNVCLFLVYLVVFYAMAPRNEAGWFMTTNVASGWDNYFVSANVGALSNIYLFIGFEAVIHMGEETHDAKRAVPRALFWSVLVDGCCGFVMLMTLLVCMPTDLDLLLDATSPLVTVVAHATGSTAATTALVSGMVVMGLGCNMTNASSVSRLTWAWARDGGLPRYFGHVDGKHRVPLRAVLLSAVLVTILSLLNLGSGTYIALDAIVSVAALASYLSYAIIFGCVLRARFVSPSSPSSPSIPSPSPSTTSSPNPSSPSASPNFNALARAAPWNLGPRLGPAVNAFALAYTCWVIVFLPFPSVLPVTAANMNYCGPVMGVVLAIALTLWFVRARRHWEGPNMAIGRLVKEEDGEGEKSGGEVGGA